MGRPPMSASRRYTLRLAAAAAAVLVLLCAIPAAAYTVWLKDGSSIAARDKYEIKGGKAIITLTNGTQSFIDAAKIDVARTEAANKGKDYGVTDLGNTRVVPGTEQAPPKPKSLSDLIATHKLSERELPGARRERAAPGQAVRSKAGNLDLLSLPPAPFANTEVSADLLQFFHALATDDVQLLAGSQPNRVLVLITASSEGAVFQGLNASANALLHARERFPQQVQAFELLMVTPAREKAGQFLLTPEVAADLVAKRIAAPVFFVANVQF
jgi:hypothetical protein